MCKLCGGTLLVLLGYSSKKSSTDTSLLSGMLKVLKHDIYIDSTTLKEQTKKFKICKEHSSLATPFEVPSDQKKITDDIKKNYTLLLKRTTKFINDHIDTDSEMHKDELLVKAVLELIEQDKSISDKQEFYILPNGKPVKKSKLPFMIKFYLPSFLLGILYYVMMNIKDNKDGAETYDKWCPKPKSGTQRKYAANIGENSTRKIVLIKTPNEYEENELLDLSGELVTLYIKPIPTNADYEISTSPIITSDCPKASEKNDYVEAKLCLRDYEKLKDFISDFNKLVYCLKKYHNSNNTDEISKIGDAKYNIADKWINNPYRIFIDDSIHKWYNVFIKKIKESPIIDIKNIKIKYSMRHSPIKLKANAKQPQKIPYTRIEYIFEEDEYNNTGDDTPENK